MPACAVKENVGGDTRASISQRQTRHGMPPSMWIEIVVVPVPIDGLTPRFSKAMLVVGFSITSRRKVREDSPRDCCRPKWPGSSPVVRFALMRALPPR